MTHPTITEALNAAKAMEQELRQAREKATPNDWGHERVDHDRSITFEIGPKVDGSYGFRFVLREENYEIEREDGEFSHNIARLKGDAEFITHAANQAISLCDTLAKLIRVVEVMEKALYSIEGERSYVESQSTGMRQYFRTEGSYTAAEALDQARAILGGEG